MRNLFVIAAFVIVLTGCKTSRMVTPNPPVITDSALCGVACERLTQLSCEEGKAVSTGIACNGDWECSPGEDCVNRVCFDSCEHFCLVSQSHGVWFDLTCVSQINSCGEINFCPLSVERND